MQRMITALVVLALSFPAHKTFSQRLAPTDSINTHKIKPMKQVLIDRFTVPSGAVTEFLNRMKINRQFIRQQPGFVEDNAYRQIGGDGEYHFVTVAVWESAGAINNARQAVAAEYKREGFDMPAMIARLQIKMDRAIYERIDDE